jgi:hypothetical protein
MRHGLLDDGMHRFAPVGSRQRSAQGPGVAGLRDVHATHVPLAFEPILSPAVDLVEAPGAGVARVNRQHGGEKPERESASTP